MSFTWADLERQENGSIELVECPDCKKTFRATPDNEVYCSRCIALFEIQVRDSMDSDYYNDYD
jgi:protein-arginine kinase activator protein McsA